MGRALWCLARHGGIQNALELFTGIGGAERPNPPQRNGDVWGRVYPGRGEFPRCNKHTFASTVFSPFFNDYLEGLPGGLLCLNINETRLENGTGRFVLCRSYDLVDN